MLTDKYWSPTNNCFPSIKLTLCILGWGPSDLPIPLSARESFNQQHTVSVPSISLGGQATSLMSEPKGQWPTIWSKEGNIVIQAWRQTIRCWRDSRDPKTILKLLW